jgi:hypothetical protein
MRIEMMMGVEAVSKSGYSLSTSITMRRNLILVIYES